MHTKKQHMFMTDGIDIPDDEEEDVEISAAPPPTNEPPMPRRIVRTRTLANQPEPEVTTTDIIKNKGGRPRNTVVKKKVTMQLREDVNQRVQNIKKALVRQADVLIKEDGEVIDQALLVMEHALADPRYVDQFLQLYITVTQGEGQG